MATCIYNNSQSNLPNTTHIHSLASALTSSLPVSNLLSAPSYNPAVTQNAVGAAISADCIDLHCVGSNWPAHKGVIVRVVVYFWGISVETDHIWQGEKPEPQVWATAKAGGENPDWFTVAGGSCCWSWGWSVVPCIDVIVTPRSRNSCCVTEPGALAGRGGEAGVNTDPVVPCLSLPQLSVSPAFPQHITPSSERLKITQGHKRPAVMTPSHTYFCIFNAVCAQMKKKKKNTAFLSNPGLWSCTPERVRLYAYETQVVHCTCNKNKNKLLSI